jgi:hypothetical protein
MRYHFKMNHPPRTRKPCRNCGLPCDRYQAPKGGWVYPYYCAVCRLRFRHPKGEDHYHWQGGERSLKQGYIRVRKPDGTRDLEHRVVWETAYGPIPKGLHVHHLNGDRADNRLKNLALLNNDAHQYLHKTLKLTIAPPGQSAALVGTSGSARPR